MGSSNRSGGSGWGDISLQVAVALAGLAGAILEAGAQAGAGSFDVRHFSQFYICN